MRTYCIFMLLCLSGCPSTSKFTCTADAQCGGNGAICFKGDCAQPSALCSSGYKSHNTSACITRPLLGSSCHFDTDCLGASCVDGVCCNVACTDRCQSCVVPGSEGICTNVPAGSKDPRGLCLVESSACGRDGTCDGSGSCNVAKRDTVCKAASCTSGIVQPASLCDGAGNCVDKTSRACAPYICNAEGTDCYASCSPGDDHCKAPNTCVSNSCGLSGLGATCSIGDQCQSGHCVDTVCCDTSACDPCYACNINGLGTCAAKGKGSTDARCMATAHETCGIKGDVCGDAGCALWGPDDGKCNKSHCDTDTKFIWQSQVCDGVHPHCPDLVLTSCLNMCYPVGDDAGCL